jgi:hypothetical protein
MNTRFLIVAIISFFLMSCSSVRKDWEKAQAENTTASYEYFLKRHPQSDFAAAASIKIEELFYEIAKDEDIIPRYAAFLERFPRGGTAEKAKLKLEELVGQRNPAFREAARAMIIIKESYAEIDPSRLGNNRPRFETEAKKLLMRAGLDVLASDSDEFDAILEIDARGTPLWARYHGYGAKEAKLGGIRYSGAVLDGTITLKIPEGLAIKKAFSGKSETASELPPASYEFPYQAPFDLALRHSDYEDKLMAVLGQAFGPSPLLYSLKIGNSRAASALDKLGWTPQGPVPRCPFLAR